MGAPDPAFSGRVPPSCSPIYRLRNLSPPPAAQVPLLLKSAVRPPRCRTHSALNPEPVRISGEDSVFLPAVFALTADGGVRRPAADSPSFRRGQGPAGSTSPFAALRKSGLSRTFASTGSPAGCAHSSGFIVGNTPLSSSSGFITPCTVEKVPFSRGFSNFLDSIVCPPVPSGSGQKL